MSVFRDAAIEYARRGWAVHPLEPGKKEPATKHGFKDARKNVSTVTKVWTDFPDCNVSIATGAVSGGLLVIDLDVDDEKGIDGIEWMYDWQKRNKKTLPETASVTTGRGGCHLYYHTDRDIRCTVGKGDTLGVDIRCNGGYVMAPPSVHPNGNVVYWDLDPDDVGITEADDAVYAFVEEVQAGSVDDSAFEAKERVGKGERDNHMYRYCCSQRSRNVPKNVCLAAALEYNKTAFDPPLPEREVRAKVNSAYKNPEGLSEEAKSRKAAKGKLGRPRKFEHDKMAAELVSKGFCYVDGIPMHKMDAGYSSGWEEVERAIYAAHPDATMANIREVKHYLTINAPKRKAAPWNVIGFANGVLDVRTMDFVPWSDFDGVVQNTVPHDWCPEEPENVADEFLDNVSCGDTSIKMNIMETIGMCLLRSSKRFGFCPVLIGSGANGKSTFLDALSYVIGEENVSNIQPSDIGKRFQAMAIMGKTANIGDDISNAYLDGESCAAIKKIATGNKIHTDVKGADGFDFTPYCTMVFSANVFPRIEDTSDGMARRLHPIEFKARFMPGMPGFDPEISEKIATPEAARRFIVMGIEAVRWMMDTNAMTETDESKRILGEIRQASSSVLEWLNELAFQGKSVEGMSREVAYQHYSDWAEENGVKRVKAGTMVSQIDTFCGLKLTRFERLPFATGSKIVRVFEKPM